MSQGRENFPISASPCCRYTWDGRSRQQSVFVIKDDSGLVFGRAVETDPRDDASWRREGLLMAEIPVGAGTYVAVVSIGHRDPINVIGRVVKSARSGSMPITR
jgi:hypothetical protein